MADFPSLSSGSVAKYPLGRTRKFRTVVYVHEDMSEQRFSKGSPLAEFTLTFNSIKTVDKETLRTFFNDRGGSFDHTWSLTLPDPAPTLYEHLQFVPGQPFQATENKPGFWTVSLKVRQVRA